MLIVFDSVTLPVTVRTRVEKDNGVAFYIPEMIGHWNPYVERKINWHMYEAIRKLSERQYEEQDTDRFSEMISTYEIKTKDRKSTRLNSSHVAISYAVFC